MSQAVRRRRRVSQTRTGREHVKVREVKVYYPLGKPFRSRKALWWSLPGLALVGGIVYGIFRFTAGEAPVEDETPVEMEEVRVEPPPPPPPEPEYDPDPNMFDDAEPLDNSALSTLMDDNASNLPSGPQVSLDLALGTGSEGMAVAGAGRSGGGGGGQGRFVYEAGQVDKEPEVQQQSPPQMPRQAQTAGVSGNFEATFVVNPQGRVESIRIEGKPEGYGYEDAIKASLQRRKYKPALAGGVPVPMKMRQSFSFSLE